jgi:large subunit ribosomal protein L4
MAARRQPTRVKAVSSAETKTVDKPLTLKVFNAKGDQVGTIDVDPAEFGGAINRQLLHEVVVMHLANRRAGTHSTLRRGEVAGSTRKLFRQKGTGNARAGTRRTNKRKGGGTAKGPKPRDYEYHLPKKAVRAATRMAVLSKFHDEEALIIDELKLPKIKTRQMADILEALKLGDNSCLIGLADHDPVVYKSARNIHGVVVAPVPKFTAYDILRSKRLLLTRAALDRLRKSTATKVPAAAK